jgi:gluconate 2-dehydrogenase gamma chain
MTRRELFRQGSLYGAGLWLMANMPLACGAARESNGRLVLSEAQWKTVEAITARILPTDHEPGAVEAGCVNFIDKALAHEDAAEMPLYEAGLAALASLCAQRHDASFAELPAEQQDAVLATLEVSGAPEFFETLRVHTLIGFLADPKYGGNRDFVGWKVTGYPGPRHPFGGATPEQMRGEEPITPVWERKP